MESYWYASDVGSGPTFTTSLTWATATPTYTYTPMVLKTGAIPTYQPLPFQDISPASQLAVLRKAYDHLQDKNNWWGQGYGKNGTGATCAVQAISRFTYEQATLYQLVCERLSLHALRLYPNTVSDGHNTTGAQWPAGTTIRTLYGWGKRDPIIMVNNYVGYEAVMACFEAAIAELETELGIQAEPEIEPEEVESEEIQIPDFSRVKEPVSV